jgi:sucrose synthase
MWLQEAVVLPPYVAFAVRMNPGIWEYVKVHSEDLSVEGITPSEYLKFKETLYDDSWYACFVSLCLRHQLLTNDVFIYAD